jgi:poly(hydroxyalkanoate) depolymerase family esterase
MSSDFSTGMAEATQLTRSGRLAEATAMIQRLLRGGAPAAAPEAKPKAPPQPTPAAAKRTGLRETVRRLVERARALDAEPVPPPVIEGARYEAASFANAAGARDYKLYVPASARGAGPRPLVLMLHGCTQNPDDFARGTGMNAAAEEAGVIVAYPGQPAGANPKRCWNWFLPENHGDEGETAILAGLVRSLVDSESVDPSRVYVAGLSAGGAAAANLAAAHPDLFAAAGVHSGLAAGAASDVGGALGAMRAGAAGAAGARTVRTIVFHGDADHVVNPVNAGAVAAQASAAAGRVKTKVERGAAGGREYSRTLHTDGRGRTLCEQWTIHGAGHAWSGGDATGSHADPLGPDASREMLRFFLKG